MELPFEERETVDAGMREVEFLDAEIAEVQRLIARDPLASTERRSQSFTSQLSLVGSETATIPRGCARGGCRPDRSPTP